MKLAEVIQLLSLFGYREEEVRARLAAGDSVHNAWEGLKVELQLRWKEAAERLGEERLDGLREAYEKLQGLTLKGALKQSDVDTAEHERFDKIARELQAGMAAQRRRNLHCFAEALEKAFERQLEENPDCEKSREALEKLKRGEAPW